jgi:hypothetical protein
MDPNQNLKQQRELAAQIIRLRDKDAPHDQIADVADELAELVQALDGWLSRGGFLPSEWVKSARAGSGEHAATAKKS